MARTTKEAVEAVLMADFGPKPDGTLPDLTPFIDTANAFTTQVYNNARTYRSVTLSSTTLELIERWLAAHFYVMSDQPLQSKSGGGGSFQNLGVGVKGSKYGQVAITCDYTRTLAAMDEGRIAVTSWLGKAPSEQIPYSDRN